MEPLRKQTGSDIDALTDEAVSSLGSTMGTFASRLQRKLRAQEIADEKFVKEKEKRHAQMMQAMLSIRKALQESARIELGKRFSLDLEVSDSDGWPRLELNLIDELLPSRIEHGLIVCANDRNGQGLIQLVNRQNGECMGRLVLSDPEEMPKLPVVLKTTIRKFLDGITPYVLNPISAHQIEEEKPMDLDDEPRGADLSNEELFTDEDHLRNENQVSTTDELVPIFSKL